MVIVDAHCHAWPYWYEPIESALDSMIRNGVDKALLMPLAEGVDSHNTYQIECMRRKGLTAYEKNKAMVE